MLEVARSLISDHETQLKAPVLFLFNGGEESLLLAAHGFMATSKWATKLGAFINLESTGPGGPAYLFQHTGASDILHFCRLSWIQGHALIQKEECLADRLQWHYINTHLKFSQAEQYHQCTQFAGLIGSCSRAVRCIFSYSCTKNTVNHKTIGFKTQAKAACFHLLAKHKAAMLCIHVRGLFPILQEVGPARHMQSQQSTPLDQLSVRSVTKCFTLPCALLALNKAYSPLLALFQQSVFQE